MSPAPHLDDTPPPSPARRPADVLVVGSFPPVGGPATAATLAALRRAWDAGEQVVTASLRAGAADHVARVAGPLAGRRLAQARAAAGGPPTLVLGLDPVQLGTGRSPVATVASLLPVLRRFSQVSVLWTAPLPLPPRAAWVLWRAVDTVVVESGREAEAVGSGVPEQKIRSVALEAGPPLAEGVSLLGPPEVLPKDIPLVAAGLVGRKLLGRHFLPVRAQVLRVARPVRGVLRRLRRLLGH